MKQALDIVAELKEISALVAGIEKNNLFSVPEGYFSEFPEKILKHIYNNGIYSSAKEEIEILSPFLASLKHNQPFSLPDNYFDNLKSQISTEEETLTPVRSISSKSKWIKYAVAAAITGFIGISAIFFINNNFTKNHSGVAAAQNNKHTDDDFNKISDDALEGYLSGMPEKSASIDSVETTFYDVAVLDLDDKRLSNILHEIPDEDLIVYAQDPSLDISL
ncbi:MAG: hypothetical protein IT249_15730 [Chitinophagaceae bacterium]|nr:hypothetical protein [Chitinophagaceae bacterium]